LRKFDQKGHYGKCIKSAEEERYISNQRKKIGGETKKMKTKTIAFLVIAAVVVSTAVVGIAMAAKDEQAGKSNVAHLYLYEKDPSDWSIVEDGAWGKMKYNLAGPTFDFVFNGHELEPNTDYNLIYYADAWPGNNPGAIIASGTSNNGGNINLAGSPDLGMDLPDSDDANYPDGAKIWLVLSDDYDGTNTKMTAWNPTEYLFENNLITYDDTDVE